MEYDDNYTAKQRVDVLLQWLDANKSINLAMLYFTEVDHAGHMFGPDSIQTKEALIQVDDAIGQLMSELNERSLVDQFNIVIVSDHGMASASEEKRIYLQDYIPDLADLAAWIDLGPVAGIIPKGKSTWLV